MFNVGLCVHRLCTAPILNDEQTVDWNKANGYVDTFVKSGKVLVMSMEMGYRAIVFVKCAFFLLIKKILVDVGGGNGYTIQRVKKCGYNVILVEPTYKACMNAKK